MKKIVQRTCIGCNLKKDRKELARLVLNKQGEFFLDKTGKAEGRGIYICKNMKCLEQAVKSKRLEKVFNLKIDNNLYEIIRGVIIENNDKEEIN